MKSLDEQPVFVQKMSKFDTVMLITRNAARELRARPMTVAGIEEGRLFLVTRVDTPKVEEVLQNPDVHVVAQSSRLYLSVEGRGLVLRDPAKIEALWQNAWRLWFPDGPKDPYMVLIEVIPARVEYWDMQGMNALRFVVEAGRALLDGEPIQEPEASHGVVELGSDAA